MSDRFASDVSDSWEPATSLLKSMTEESYTREVERFYETADIVADSLLDLIVLEHKNGTAFSEEELANIRCEQHTPTEIDTLVYKAALVRQNIPTTCTRSGRTSRRNAWFDEIIPQ